MTDPQTTGPDRKSGRKAQRSQPGREDRASTPRWHASDTLLRAYGGEQLNEVDAWSVEAHLESCESCRARLVSWLSPAPAAVVARSWRSIGEPGLRAPGRARPGTRARRARWLLLAAPSARRAFLGAVPGMLAVFALLHLLVGDQTPTALLVLLIAPLVPVAGVALSYGVAGDPAHELLSTTAVGGLRILLWRTVTCLLAAAPLILGVALIGRQWTFAAVSCLACLTLTSAVLALSSVLDTHRAALVVAVGWVVPVVLSVRSDRLTLLLDPAVASALATCAAAAIAVTYLRRSSFDVPYHSPEPAR
ncbi:MAG: hypothetical protein ACRC35_09105 [Angustibacter sp.]